MRVVSSIYPKEVMQDDIRGKFPEISFEFFRGMENAEEAFYDCDIFLTYGTDLTEKHIYESQSLKWIMVMAAGLDKMPLYACREKGVIVTNARGIHKIPMAEYTLGAMLQWEKQTKAIIELEKNHDWNRKIKMGELCGKTLLIIGVGAIGSEIGRLAKAFRMNTIGVNRSGQKVEFIDEIHKVDNLLYILPQADYIVTVLPSTPETRGSLSIEHFAAMKNTAVFINIGRGDLVDEKVLINALERKEIAHAFLDVFEKEPLEHNHLFWNMENVTVTPHLSALSKNYLPRAMAVFEQNLINFIHNENSLMNKIDFNKGY
jgi:phosphoglycerate dehydrogenase-like enzyme